MASHPLSVALSIAGSDSGGGAGIQADLKTFHAFGVFGATAVTAITVQNTLGVQAVHAIPADIVRMQISAVVDDLAPSAVKTGMLASRELVEAVGAALVRHALPNYVLDPVMVATSGDRLLDADAESAVARILVPLATVVTPNLPEASVLTGLGVNDVSDLSRAARALVDMGAAAALVKGGHLPSDEVVDVLWDGREERSWRRPRIRTGHTHGTGCTLSAAVAAGLARGRPLPDAVAAALDYVARAIREAPGLGGGRGPLNHFVAAEPSEPSAGSRLTKPPEEAPGSPAG
ncbi:MAG TPA: bifunctional hydroxymethylpyrimidine kinase/phosphomethylpyrimidine kinase [Longimicrobiales bacterium]|jgi:hydroxymethylpyrimidine/phosphomethylpyrimidine kinase